MGQYGKPMPGESAVQEMPAEYLEYKVCELFHCTPSQLDHEEWDRVASMMIVHKALSDYSNRGGDGSLRLNLDE